jgi:hypothetical protein
MMLPRSARLARLLLLPPLPFLAFILLSVPVRPSNIPRAVSWAVVALELVLALTCFVALGTRRPWGWKLAAALGFAASTLLVTRAVPAFFVVASWGGPAVTAAAVTVGILPQLLLAAAGLLAWHSRDSFAPASDARMVERTGAR